MPSSFMRNNLKGGNIMQNIQKVFCPSCGAPIQFLEGRDYTFCSHCGHQLFREDTQLDIKLKHEQVKMKYADKHEERVYNYKKEEKKQKGGVLKRLFEAVEFVGLILVILVIVAIMLSMA
jgi:predicted amidophosphoribosyltransferase